jgi:phosphoribosylformylglycinamidine synthase
VIESAHDVADGGTFITLLESAMVNNLGFDITTCSEIREDAFLFGEAPSRVIVSVREVKEDRFLDILKKSNQDFSLLGHVSKSEIRIDDISFGEVKEYKEIYQNALAEKLV